MISEDNFSPEDDLAHSIWELAYQFLKARAETQLFYTTGFPHVLACSLSPSLAESQRLVSDIWRPHESSKSAVRGRTRQRMPTPTSHSSRLCIRLATSKRREPMGALTRDPRTSQRAALTGTSHEAHEKTVGAAHCREKKSALLTPRAVRHDLFRVSEAQKANEGVN